MGCLHDFKRTYKTLADTTLHLMKKVPEGKEDWKPPTGEFMTMGQLLYHQGDCQMFLKKIFEGTMRELDKNFMEYMANHPSASKEEAIKRFKEEHEKVMEYLDNMTEKEFLNKKYYFWTVDDEPMPFIAFNVIEHNASHKYQLFMYLKLMGLPGIDSFALGGEDTAPREQVLEMYAKAHEAYEKKHSVKA
ncbi:MAG: DinB family protein [Candidatus Eremiobacteraeota bacterium]|nr:DinB family protein [Candidatus Eremiobacteraeota bacterium]